jgi:spore coat protein A
LTPLGNQVRLMTHLHGGFVAASSDGSPAATPLGFGFGETQTVLYTNQATQMPASLLWFHDHGLGATRLNVFAGLAAAISSTPAPSRTRSVFPALRTRFR